MFFEGKSEDCFNLIKQKLEDKMKNLENTLIRNEYKLEIYGIYILPSIRFLLTVHDLRKTYLLKLDTFTDQFIKKWAGLPRCATTAIIHLQTGLNIKKISTLYTESHCISHCSTRLKGDKIFNSVLDNRLERESKLTRKQSITVLADKHHQSALNDNLIQGEIPTDPALITLSDTGGGVEVTGVVFPTSKQFVSAVKGDVKFK